MRVLKRRGLVMTKSDKSHCRVEHTVLLCHVRDSPLHLQTVRESQTKSALMPIAGSKETELQRRPRTSNLYHPGLAESLLPLVQLSD